MSKVLVPVDGSENSLRAVRYAVAMAKEKPGTQFHLLHVVDPSEFIDDNYWKPNAIERLTQDGQSKLNAAKKLFDDAGIPCEAELVVGSARNVIADHARSKGCDSIIMGTRGMSPMAAMFIGSVAQRVLHTADVPVTLIK